MDIERELLSYRITAIILVVGAALCFYWDMADLSLFCLLFAAAGFKAKKEDLLDD